MAPKAPAPRAPASPPKTPAGAPITKAAPVASALALAPAVDDDALAALREAGIDVEQDESCAELVPSDFKTVRKRFNLKDKVDGRQRRQDRFYDSVTGEEQEVLEFAILGLHKSNLYGVFDAGEGRTNRVCSSFDQVTGVWAEDGRLRNCENCPDKRAVKQPDGKVRSNCTEVDDLMCVELTTSRVFVLTGKRTSRPPIMNYLHQHHFGKGGGRSNIPLYAYRVRAWLEMDPKGNFAQLMLERGDVFAPADLKVLAESAKGVRETLAERLAEVEAQGSDGHDGGGEGSSGSYGYEPGAEPQKFVNSGAV